MGNSDSKPTEQPRDRHGPRDKPRDTGRVPLKDWEREMLREREERKTKEQAAVTASPKQPSQPKPIAIPTTQQSDRTEASPAQPIPVPTSATSEDVPDTLPPSDFDFTRPPRLPLPIGEETYAPGSPIFSPQQVADDVDPQPLDPDSPVQTSNVPRRTSLLSSTTADDEEDEDFEERTDELQHGNLEGTVKTVPTMVEWLEGGDKVYVTGTFANWDRKIRLRENGPSRRPNALSAVIQFPPGTHHVRFIIDGDMRTSKHLPTAVDFAGFLVNYIEISSAPPSATPSTTSTTAVAAAAQVTGPTAPVDIPTGRQQTPVQTQQQRDLPHRDTTQHRPSPSIQERQAAQVPADSTAAQPKPLLERPQAGQQAPLTPTTAPAVSATKDRRSEYRPAQLVRGPSKKYHNDIPRFLLDLDSAEDSPRLARANAVAATLPAPPSLPLFLAKSILNKETSMKDDASVLVLPNHTVLNHLATSSIKDKVLATSATTRYKQKMLTTIMFKPTSDKPEAV